ncbi:3'(2'),5'-bisphosphate nucleotidase [Geodermatophilus saharensis]|uniref:3'(2'),5'-bisphosphate nucleotidase n=1 Tax=Geodermatophilus saharensis TaxID=1137994 RepID=A0A238ZJ79_9ACTN|nr:inositol monophosphatase family protein [Geodermatophilus saharensis]SNR83101.1 3'(2'),5'-bisphosphate nucleotidase [Geodermatophilus saharensis]
MRDVEVADAAARAAAAALVELRAGGLTGGALGDAGDAAAQVAITAVLARHRPDDVVFSEEAADDRSRLGAGRVWIVDPLDGTREYGETDRSDFAVHVALWASGRLSAAAVALPAVGEVLLTDPAPPPPAAAARRPRIAVSRTRPPAQAAAAARAVGGELVPLGSAGWKTTAVVRGEVDAYVHAGGMYQWDSAAPVAVAQAAGLTALRLDGSPLRYNEPDPSLPDLLVCRPELAADLLAAVR